MVPLGRRQTMIELIKNSKGQYCERLSGAGRPWPLTDEEIISRITLKDDSLSRKEAVKIMEEAKRKADNFVKEEVNLDDLALDACKSINPFKNIKVYRSPQKDLIVHESDKGITILGKLEILTAKYLSTFLATTEPELYEQIVSELPKYINPKSPMKVTALECIQLCINLLKPEINLPRINIEVEDLHPATVEGCDVVSLKKIPFSQKDVTFTDLNPYLQEFLKRVENHEHLCAIIWGQLTGKKWPYICYLYGKKGREGKSAFINMIGSLSSNETLEKDSRFSLFPLYGKSFITVPENDKARLVSSSIVKAMTGNSPLKLEEKGKTSFTGRILGTILVDANVPPKISGKDFEIDRLRFFNVRHHGLSNDERMEVSKYETEIKSTPNEFLNYCRQCYKQLRTPGDMLKEPSNHQELMESLEDVLQDYLYSEALEKTIKKLSVTAETTEIERGLFISTCKDMCKNKQDFYETSFLDFLEKKGCIIENKRIKGLNNLVKQEDIQPNEREERLRRYEKIIQDRNSEGKS